MSSKLPSGIVSKSTSYMADPAHIVRREGWNTRFDFGDLDELMASIQANGFRKSKPLVVRRNAESLLEIIDGERRFTAVQNLMERGVEFPDGIPVVIEDKTISDVDGTVLMLTANNGKAFLPLEEAAAYKRLIDGGLKVSDISARLGRSEVHVKDRLALLSAAPEVREALEKKEIGSTLAENIVNHAKDDHKKQADLVKKAKTSKKDKKEVKKEVEKTKTPDPAPQERTLSLAEIQAHEMHVMLEMTELLKNLGLDESNIHAHIQSSDETAAAFYFGALLAFRKARGLDVQVKV